MRPAAARRLRSRRPTRRTRRARRLHTTDAAPHLLDAPDCADGPDEGEEAEEHGPQRRCIVTRAHGERAAMLRFVVGPDGSVVFDVASRLPGRGMWLSPRADVLETARAKGAFSRAARTSVRVPRDLKATIEAGLYRRIAEHLGLARRAGQAVAGFAKAREVVAAGRAALVVQASDGSEDECRRFASAFRDGGPAVAWPLDGASLGTIFGRDHVVHVALTAGRLAGAILNETERLAGISGQVMTKQAGG